MPHVIGTAGHIDHGKTALIRALTGQDTDRLKEEKERGISIDLGFAYMDLPNGERAGIVDVPGHERFIRNMLAGAHGIDLVLLVVAADDGVMPQTEEHLDIVHLLGVAHGVVAITKADLVDAARLAAVREEVEILLSGTTLENAPVIPVSSVTGMGIDTLRRTIAERLAGYRRVAPTGYFRLPVDRAFVMHGHGTVVTGTAIAGAIHPGDTVRILPGGEEVRVRTVQVHGREVPEATCGMRVALNLAGVERSQVQRGHVVCDPRLDRVTDRFDAWVEIRPAAGRPVESHEVVRVYLGTAEVIGKLLRLDGRDAWAPRQSGLAQLALRDAVHALRGDRFILRNQSAQRTIGGGVVTHPFARKYRHGGIPLAALDALRLAPTPSALVRALLDVEPDFAVTPEFVAQAGALSLDTVRAVLGNDASIRALPNVDTVAACTTSEKWAALRAAVAGALAEQHRLRPLVPGLEMESLRSQIAPDLSPKVFRAVLDALVAEDVIARDDSLLRLPSHRVALRRDEEEVAGRAEALLAAGGFTPPDLKEVETALGVARPRLQALLQQLEREGRVAKIAEGLYFARTPLDRARDLLRAHVVAHGEISAATFRDLLGASRKFSIALLDYFDRTGFTLRVGDVRKLRGPAR
ncbi:MAG TPA: selenocysteine-specific translation elongation factor [Candidatus Margulisiibacteriota bacterium]|nr:selenocysteine-specific translation elongation factor [Candidatus Margulisiibacteriota bacterium]